MSTPNHSDNDSNHSDDRSNHLDEEAWREWIAAADPRLFDAAADTEYSAVLERLQTKLSHVLEENSLVSHSPDATAPPTVAQTHRSVSRHRRNPWRPWIVAASIAAIAMIAVVGSLWWQQNSNMVTQPRTQEQLDGEPPTDSLVQSQQAPNVDKPLSNPNESDISPTAPESLTEAGQRSGERIQTVSELVKLSPSQLVRVQRRLEWNALGQELQTWLRLWGESTPDERAELEQQWVSNRGFWSSWTIKGLREWTEPTVLQAGIEVLCLELGPQAAESLAFCYDRSETRTISLPYLLPLASETQLVKWLQSAEDCEVVPQLITELARRSGPIATDALSHLASDRVCRQLLHQLPWNAAHVTRAVNTLNTNNAAQQYRAAMLLTAIELPEVDSLLLQKASNGVQTLPATAILMLRHENAVEKLAEKVRHSPTILASIPSANLRVQRWMRQQRLTQPLAR